MTVADQSKQQPEWALVFTSNRPTEIEAAAALLEEQSIPSFKIDKKDSSYIFGEIELYVPEQLAPDARLILTENDLL